MHQEYTMLMSLVLDGEATSAEMRRLQEHLRSCADCAATYGRWQALHGRLAAAPSVEPPSSLAIGVMARIEEGELARRRARWVGSGLCVGWAGVATVGLLLAGGLVLWGAAHPQDVGAIASWFSQLLSGLSWLVRGVSAIVEGVGLPAVAAGVGMLACLTCALAVLWLRLVARDGAATSAALTIAG